MRGREKYLLRWTYKQGKFATIEDFAIQYYFVRNNKSYLYLNKREERESLSNQQ